MRAWKINETVIDGIICIDIVDDIMKRPGTHFNWCHCKKCTTELCQRVCK